MIRQLSFKGQMAFSDGVNTAQSLKDILVDNIPGAISAYRAGSGDDRNGTDYWIKHQSGKLISIDCKIRDVDFAKKTGEDDLALETWSVVEKQVIGWTLNEKKRTDFILWYWQDTGRWCLISFPMLCQVFQANLANWANKYKRSQQKTPEWGGYHSECVFVPRREVWAEIYKHFG